MLNDEITNFLFLFLRISENVNLIDTLDVVNNKMDALNDLNSIEDYGEPVYVEAHGGKNHVIMYRSRTNPKLAIEFFFRSVLFYLQNVRFHDRTVFRLF